MPAAPTPTMMPDDWRRWHGQGHCRLPFMLTTEGETLPASWEGFAGEPVTALLESAPGGRYTYFCDRPARVVVGDSGGAQIFAPGGNRPVERRVGSPLEVVEALRREAKALVPTDWPAMAGGFIGAFGYDLVRTWEKLPQQADRDLPLPLYVLIETAELFIYDLKHSRVSVVVWTDLIGVGDSGIEACYQAAERSARAALERWRTNSGRLAKPVFSEPSSESVPADSFSRDGFCDAVRTAQEFLLAGHTYQTNLSLRQSRPAPATPEAIYEAVRRVNPSPYMGLLRLPDFALICGSPELLFRLVDGRIVSRPIAGTRPRGVDAPGDQHLSAELAANEKERAEHLMLVDLIRNDIGHVAEWGSVRVSEFMTIERYSHVMHLVSEVEGRLARGRNWVDAMRAMFPGGTITGCPKIRTMEIIEELEPVGRGFYTGSLGWIDYRGNAEMNIIIRTMLVERGLAHVQAGAGIVADSVPEREYEEAQHKARALWVAWEMAVQHG